MYHVPPLSATAYFRAKRKGGTMSALTDADLHAIARATTGLPWTDIQVSPLVRQLLHNLHMKDSTHLLRLLGPEVSGQILKIDLTMPPPEPAKVPDIERVRIPLLPPEAQLSDTALQAGEQVGRWLTDFSAWATRRSPMTPPLFLVAGGLWALGLAIARRCAAPLHKPIYPHLYVLWVAVTSLFKKTTGMEAIYDLFNAAMPHMLLPEESTPEAFIAALGGKKPPNYESLSPYEKKLEDTARIFAAQRGVLLDEASSLFGAIRRDYMQGHAEMIMRLYDAPHRYTRNLRSEGKIVIYEASLCILGATTPASLNRNIDAQSWETGELARFVLLYPDQEMPYNVGSGLEDYAPPADLVKRLAALHRALPKPPDSLLMDGDKPPERHVLSALISKEAFAAYDAYTKAVTYDLLKAPDRPDARLHANYTRLHIQAVKVALSLAAIDWADAGGKGPLHITLGHWSQAQQIAERWRFSAHRLLDALNRGEDTLTETRILDHLASYAEGETLRDLTRRTGLRRKAIEEALRALIEAGLVREERRRRGERGPESTVYSVAG
jgi:DNA-binding transcriptional ArsR family regulator